MDFNVEDEGVLLKLLVKEGDTVKLGAPVANHRQGGRRCVGARRAGDASGRPCTGTGTRSRAQAGRERRRAHRAERSRRPRRPRLPRPRLHRLAPPRVAHAPRRASRRSRRPRRPSSSPPARQDPRDRARPRLRTIQGSGPGGRIVERDVRQAADGVGSSSTTGNGHASDAATAEAANGHADEAAAPTQALAVRHARQLVPDAAATSRTCLPRTCASGSPHG